MNISSFFIVVLSLIAIGERTLFNWGPNIELVTTVSVVAGMVATTRWRLLAPLLVMFISDLYLGVGWITLFTWSGFLLMPWIAVAMKQKVSHPLLAGGVSGVVGVSWFYIWTNFGVWLTESYSMYPNTLAGLVASYVAGLPFMRLQLLSALASVPLALVTLRSVELIWQRLVGQARLVSVKKTISA